MTKTKKQKVVMPASIRSKMVSATAMLLVAAILMVSSTYAWFTLSTAPEVTGITTQVGANGNLEIALLTTATYDSPDSITSSAGDSMASKATTLANVTWGNLVDLSDSSYGLSDISLLPAALNSSNGTLTPASPLSIPVYGADGRVDTVDGGTVTAAKDKDTSAFTYVQDTPSYGVRAVGVASNLSSRQLAYTSAKSSFNAAKNSATVSTTAAISANSTLFISLVIDSTAPTNFSVDQLKGALAIAEGMKTDLNTILSAYKNLLIANAAAQSTDNLSDTAFDELKTAVNTATASTLADVANANGSSYSTELTALATAQSNVDAVISDLNTKITANALVNFDDVKDDLSKLLGGSSKSDIPHVTEGSTYYLNGGALGTIADNAGAFLIGSLGVTVYGAPSGTWTTKDNMPAGKLTALSVTDGTFAASASSNITDTYGYVLDFAFRTNASSSKLLLQTAAENRVYTDGSNGTQGSGSNVTLTYANGLQASQAKTLLGALRVTFYNPATGEIYATAACSAITAGDTSASADLYLISATADQYTLGKDAYDVTYGEAEEGGSAPFQKATVKADIKTAYTNGTTYYVNYVEEITDSTTYENLNDKTTKESVTTLSSDKGAITSLTQNTAEKVSALVYLDGENIDNTAVVNAASSGTLKLNLQFSSSADLVPMSNTALKTLTTATITGSESMTTGATGNYTVSASGKTVKEVEWSSNATSVASVASDNKTETTTVTAGSTTGEATITAKVTFTDNTTATATFKITVTSATSETTTVNESQGS